ncbi:hypothetical protein MFIFM68171_02391 [Madurella fahalii]|uniref:Mitochondrial inner-membrane-bound regulator-domain-containing protein n=1 Tax=Madurella fahalii TaxID=1157608 RepID=A0ABQ0G354_9PEZI
MLGRKLASSAGFVCLRCRLQLVGTVRRIPFPALAVSPVRYHLRRIGTHDVPAATDGPDGGRPSGETNPETYNETSREVDNEQARPLTASQFTKILGKTEKAEREKHFLPPGQQLSFRRRLYESRGHRMWVEPEGLSVGFLGKPATALVMREATYVRRTLPQLAPDSGNTQLDAASLLPSEAADSESASHIHELMPTYTRVVSGKEFTALKRTLMEGFTAPQLHAYVREWQAVQQLLAEQSASEEPPWILERQPWRPLDADATQNIEPQLCGYVSQNTPPKEKLAIRLMRECWDLSSLDVLDRHDGELSVRLRDIELSLLLRNRRLLGAISRSFPGKPIKISAHTGLITIMAPKTAAEAILNRINSLILQARTDEFAVDLVSPTPIEPAMLDEVGRLTNSVTRLDPTGKKVVITWIHLTDRTRTWENYGETVLRLLRNACSPKRRASFALEVVPPSLARRGRYVTEINYQHKLPWQERLTTWERWVAAVPQPSLSRKSSPRVIIPPTFLPLALDPTQAIREPEERVGSAHGWSSELQTDTTAVFGHVVFAGQEQSSPPPPQPERRPQLDVSRPRTFVPLLPPLLSLDFPTNLHETGLWHTTIVIRLAPDPDMSPDLASSAPDLELRIEADNRELKRIISLRALMHTFTGDVLFPSCPVDARITQQCYFTLPGRHINKHAGPLSTDFLAKSDLRPWEGKLKTPHHVRGLRLPRRLLSQISFQPPSPSPSTGSGKKNGEINSNRKPIIEPKASDNELVTLDYRFATIELQRTVAAEYASLKLRYTNIEAGQRGGRRAEISLEAAPVTEAEARAAGAPGVEVAGEGNAAFVDDTVSWASFTSHIMNMAKEPSAPPAKPVHPLHFIRAVTGVPNERGDLKWQTETELGNAL